MQSSILLLLLAFCIRCVLAAPNHVEKWRFDNWNKYKNDKSSKAESWASAWGIPKSKGWAWPRDGGNYEIVKDPASNSDKTMVLRVEYPKGSSNPANEPQGGIGFYAQPVEFREEAKLVVLEYKVFFPKNFDFVKGGKLPGLYGGHEGCSGGADATSCFSTRFMWRKEAAGEVYAYMPECKQRDGLCDEEGNICNPDYGYSLGRGSWTFKTGEWVTLKQRVKLNTPGQLNGQIEVLINGKQVYNEKQLVFLSKKTGRLIGIAFHTFFGGSDDSWAPQKDEHTYFKDFKVWAYY